MYGFRIVAGQQAAAATLQEEAEDIACGEDARYPLSADGQVSWVAKHHKTADHYVVDQRQQHGHDDVEALDGCEEGEKGMKELFADYMATALVRLREGSSRFENPTQAQDLAVRM